MINLILAVPSPFLKERARENIYKKALSLNKFDIIKERKNHQSDSPKSTTLNILYYFKNLTTFKIPKGKMKKSILTLCSLAFLSTTTFAESKPNVPAKDANQIFKAAGFSKTKHGWEGSCNIGEITTYKDLSRHFRLQHHVLWQYRYGLPHCRSSKKWNMEKDL